jgi:hypothetical protein
MGKSMTAFPEPLESQLAIPEKRVQDLGASLTLFPLRPIPCNCKEGPKCKRVGKHPASLWNSKDLGAREKHVQPGALGYGIACGARSGIIVLDLDTLDIKPPGELLETFTVQTPRGAHIYYRWPGRYVKTSAGEIGTDIDLRADGGFACAPGSVHKTGATYEIAEDVPIVDAPAWLLRHEATFKTGKGGAIAKEKWASITAAPGVPEGKDLEWRVKEARKWLEFFAPPCIEGSNAQKHVWLVGLQLMRTYELPLETVLPLFDEVYNPRCKAMDGGPYPWEPYDVERVLTRARDHGQRTPGCPSPYFRERFS